MLSTVNPQTLAQAVGTVLLTTLNYEVYYRSASLEVQRSGGISVLDGSHAGMSGGRYNAPNSEPLTYFAGSQTLAVLETEQTYMMTGNLY